MVLTREQERAIFAKIANKLNSKIFSKSPYKEKFLLVEPYNIESAEKLKDDKIRFVFKSNTSDFDEPQRLIKKAGFDFIDKKDILDTRRLTFEGKL